MSVKPSDQEDRYFAELELARRKNAAAAHESRAAETERLRVVAEQQDRCPQCGAPLVAVRYRGVEVDRCPRCRKVWPEDGKPDHGTARKKGFLAGLMQIVG